MTKRLLPGAMLVTALMVAGCVKYDERIELNPDGSGVVRMHLVIPEQLMPPSARQLPPPEERTEGDLWPVATDKLKQDLEAEGFKVMSLRAESARGMRHFYLVLGFGSIDTLRKSETFGARKVTLTDLGGGKWRFNQEISVSEESLTGRSPVKRVEDEPKTGPDGKPVKKDESVVRQLEKRFGKEKTAEMLRNYTISFSVGMKGAGLLHTNGENHRDVTAVWAVPISEMIGKRPLIRMDAEFARATPRTTEP